MARGGARHEPEEGFSGKDGAGSVGRTRQTPAPTPRPAQSDARAAQSDRLTRHVCPRPSMESDPWVWGNSWDCIRWSCDFLYQHQHYGCISWREISHQGAALAPETPPVHQGYLTPQHTATPRLPFTCAFKCPAPQGRVAFWQQNPETDER